MSHSVVRVRLASEEDLPALGALVAEGARFHAASLPEVFAPPPSAGLDLTYLQRYFTYPDARIFVAEGGGTPSAAVIGIAQCAVRHAPERETLVPRVYVYVETLVVAPSARRRGVGRALMARAEAWARELGIPTLELTVFSFNTAALRLYEGLGYRSSACTLTKQLEPAPSAPSA